MPVSDSLKRLEIGSALSAPELLPDRQASSDNRPDQIRAVMKMQTIMQDCLDVYFEQLAPLTPLSAEIDRCILGER